MADTFTPTARTKPSRIAERVSYERATANAIIDEALLCHLSFTVDDEPRVLPTLQVRLEDTLYLHGSTGSRPLLAARDPAGLPVAVAVTHLDGLVLARSQFHHSANYRSVVVHGRATLVTDEDTKRRVLNALVDKVATGRSAQTRPPSRRELAETAMLALPLHEVSVKVRTGGVSEEPEDLDLPYWAGVVPLRLTPGLVEPDRGVTVPVPSALRTERSAWCTAVAMGGDHVLLEPLDMSHVDGLFAAIADEEVFRWIPVARPTTVDEMADLVREALLAYERATRVPFVQRSASTGAVIGTTSFYLPDTLNRTIAIGYTMLSRQVWRSGVNTESKLLMMGRAFDELGAVRVEWHTDLLNTRSQQAIERLGATREGVHRRHRLRSDGTWRDTVTYAMTDDEWPIAQRRLTERLRNSAPAA